jgi:hypothetical protein
LIDATSCDCFRKGSKVFQLILSRYIENDLESVGFKVNDAYVIPTRPLIERTITQSEVPPTLVSGDEYVKLT